MASFFHFINQYFGKSPYHTIYSQYNIMLKRVHLFEFCDQPWIKGWIREGFMDCLAFTYFQSRPYHNFASILEKSIGDNKVFDLATGGGESVEFFLQHLKNKSDQSRAQIIGTDLFPDLDSLEKIKTKYPQFDYIANPVDAFDPPGDENSSYLIFSAFHHFKEQDAIRILQSCLFKEKSLTIFEFTSRRNIMNYLWLLPGFFVFAFIVPFTAKKWRWQKFLFSMFIPVIPFMFVFDGLISNLRTYNKKQLEALAKAAFPNEAVTVDYQEQRFNFFFKSYMCRFSLR